MNLNKEQQEAVNFLIGNDYSDSKGSEKIARYLLQDFMYLLNMALMKAICSKMEDAESFIQTVRDAWDKRVVSTLSMEEKKLSDAIIQSIQSADEIDEQLETRMKSYLTKYRNVKDNALNQACVAVDNICKMILEKNNKEEENEN